MYLLVFYLFVVVENQLFVNAQKIEASSAFIYAYVFIYFIYLNLALFRQQLSFFFLTSYPSFNVEASIRTARRNRFTTLRTKLHLSYALIMMILCTFLSLILCHYFFLMVPFFFGTYLYLAVQNGTTKLVRIRK